ncbi:MAG: hypothetical protein NZ898_09850 [Myxococcota bacterium]|nr:hypothetical protein [Myxococcota bacterium]MDW8363512.1 hypothetical protein [Myxococcales bacterium]
MSLAAALLGGPVAVAQPSLSETGSALGTPGHEPAGDAPRRTARPNATDAHVETWRVAAHWILGSRGSERDDGALAPALQPGSTVSGLTLEAQRRLGSLWWLGGRLDVRSRRWAPATSDGNPVDAVAVVLAVGPDVRLRLSQRGRGFVGAALGVCPVAFLARGTPWLRIAPSVSMHAGASLPLLEPIRFSGRLAWTALNVPGALMPGHVARLGGWSLDLGIEVWP